jgi:2'-5' RNA ligase
VRSLLERARARRRGPATALIVPVPGLPIPPPAQPGLPHHVTVIYPFLGRRLVTAQLVAELHDVFAASAAFDFDLTAVGRFPGVLYLAPEPAAPFIELTRRSTERWPTHPPYGGAFPEVVPHLTLAEGAEPPGLEDQVASLLPVRARAEEIWLMERAARTGWTRAARISLDA